ncbi:MAG: CapA family protein [Deltaproteobacteria bacterium]|nr:CapA family protein [Deltaproteobacteria bacterium]
MPTISSFNWKQGSWTAGTKARHSKKNTATVCIAGDLAPIRAFKNIMVTDPTSLYGDLLPVLRTFDLSVVNLESPLSDRGTPVFKSGSVFKGESCYVKALTAVPFDIATLANNHVLDYGIEAFKDTLDVLDRNNIKRTGAGMSEKGAFAPLVTDVNGIRIAIVNFSEGEDLTSAKEGPGVMGWDLGRIEDTIKSLRQETDIIIVVSHCGIEYIPFPPPYVVKAFKKMADAGADVVIGHHPHVPQGIQFYNQVPICYSLGNFAFYQETDLMYRKLGYLVGLELNKDRLLSLKLIPYKICDHGLSLLKNPELKSFLDILKKISLPLDDNKKIYEAWHGFLHYYGVKGFFNEISMIMEKMKIEPEKGAAMFRNRLTTLQHLHHWKDFLTHMVDGKLETPPRWSKALVELWLTCKIDDPGCKG